MPDDKTRGTEHASLRDDFDDRAFRDRFVARTLQQVEGLVADSTTYVIEIDGERAGRLRVVRTPDALEIAGIQLLPAHQGHGIGTYLIEQLLVEAHDAGQPARVRAGPDNPRALGCTGGWGSPRSAPTTAR